MNRHLEYLKKLLSLVCHKAGIDRDEMIQDVEQPHHKPRRTHVSHFWIGPQIPIIQTLQSSSNDVLSKSVFSPGSLIR